MLLNKPTDKNVFGILPLSSEIGESMTDFAVTKLGAKRVAIFFQNDQFGKDQRDGAVEALKSHGLSAGRGGELRPERCRCERTGGGAQAGES